MRSISCRVRNRTATPCLRQSSTMRCSRKSCRSLVTPTHSSARPRAFKASVTGLIPKMIFMDCSVYCLEGFSGRNAVVILPLAPVRRAMSLSAVIVDDEQLARDELAYLLKNAGDVDVVAQGKNGVEAVNLIREHNPDVVFLDVQMPGLDGFGVIKKLLDKKVPIPNIVFATAFDQYAVKAFEVNAVDYLLKPFDKKRVAQSVQKARDKMDSTGSSSEKLETLVKMLGSQKPQAMKILLKAAGRLFLVNQKDICYASIADGVITVITTGPNGMEGQSNCRTLEELLASLDENLFWRAHRSYLVNINRIKEVVPWFKSSYQLRMDDKKQTEVPVSRAQTKRLRELFGL